MAIVKEHLVDGVSISDLCGRHHILPTQFYQWQKQLFEQGREPAFDEGYERFVEVGEILVAKYGKRLKDFAPADRRKLFLFGDALIAIQRVDNFRQRLRTGAND